MANARQELSRRETPDYFGEAILRLMSTHLSSRTGEPLTNFSSHSTVAAFIGAMATPLLLVTAPMSSAAPECDPYDPTGPACPSGPTGGCDPYSSDGSGFLGCLGENWQEESAGSATGSSGGPPTITNPQDVYAVTEADVYTLICNDLDVNGVSVPSVEDIYHVLYVAPYGYAKRDAGRAVALAVRTTCPRHQPAMDEAVRQATS
jgi:hypothetical protein